MCCGSIWSQSNTAWNGGTAAGSLHEKRNVPHNPDPEPAQLPRILVHGPAFELQWGVDQSYGPIRGLFYSVFHNRLWDQKRPISWINPQRFTQTADLRGLVGCSSSTKAQPMCFPSSIEPYTTLKRRPYYRTLYDP